MSQIETSRPLVVLDVNTATKYVLDQMIVHQGVTQVFVTCAQWDFVGLDQIAVKVCGTYKPESEGSDYMFEYDVWINEAGELYGEW